MKIYIKYHAYSNITYRGTWEMDVDDEEWAELTEHQKQAMIDEYARDQLNSDIGWRVEE